MTCDMCGSEGQLYKAEIEGVILTVCANCTKYGKALSKIRNPSPAIKESKKTELKQKPEIIEAIISNYPLLIKNAREKLGLKQKDLAIKLHEKESVIHSLETGQYEPNIELAKKIEKFLNIELIEEFKEELTQSKASRKDDEVTLGDLVKIKSRKK